MVRQTDWNIKTAGNRSVCGDRLNESEGRKEGGGRGGRGARDSSEAQARLSTPPGRQQRSSSMARTQLPVLSKVWSAVVHPGPPTSKLAQTPFRSSYSVLRTPVEREKNPAKVEAWSATWPRWAERERGSPSRPSICGGSPGRTYGSSSASTRTASATCAATAPWRSCAPAWGSRACPGPPRRNGNPPLRGGSHRIFNCSLKVRGLCRKCLYVYIHWRGKKSPVDEWQV